MKLNTAGISVIRGNKGLWEAIRVVLDVSKGTMYRYVQTNDEALTLACVMKVIKEFTGLTDQEILEVEKVSA